MRVWDFSRCLFGIGAATATLAGLRRIAAADRRAGRDAAKRSRSRASYRDCDVLPGAIQLSRWLRWKLTTCEPG